MSHYFLNDDSIKTNEIEHQSIVNQISFTFITDNGVFSKRGLDFGTRTLLESLPELKGEILDFGCGYGPIGIVIKKQYDVQVDMIDINQRSLELAKKNAQKNQVDVTIMESNLYQNIKKKYDYIITNPPIRVGKQILYTILMEAPNYLKKNGELWFVIHKDQGAKTVFRDLNSKFDVKIVTKKKGFYVISLKKH